MLTIQITGLEAVRAQLANAGKQATFAAQNALNNAAFGLNAKIKAEMQGAFQGGATKYTLAAFKVEKATKANLAATVMLRKDSDGGTPRHDTLGHLFTGGNRRWKKFEGLIRAAGAMPRGTIAVPGKGIKLDSRGNMSKAQITEILRGIESGMQTLNKAKTDKNKKATGYFVLPTRQGKLLPGIYKRTTTGGWVGGGKASSGITPMLVFVPMGTWRKYIDLDAIAQKQLQCFVADFNTQLRQALATAK